MKDIANYALEALKKAGADKASCRVEKARKDEFNIEANEFTLLGTTFDNGLAMKALVGGRKGVVSINKLDKGSVDEAARNCVELAKAAEPDEAEDIAPLVENKDFVMEEMTNDIDGLFKRSKEYLEQVRDELPKIIIEGFSSALKSSEEAYVNTNGVCFGAKWESYSFNSMFVGKEGESSSSFNYDGANFLKPTTPFMQSGMHRTLLEEAERSTNPRPVDEKFTGKIIVTPACADLLWDTILSNFISDRPLIEGTSRWKDALDTKVASEKLTFRAAPLIKEILTGPRYTNDGFVTRDVDFIKDGVLKSFALSLYGANKTGKPLNPTSSYNMEVLAGDVPLDEIIKSVDNGILLNRFSGGSPGASGDISGVAKNSFLIKNGKISDALQETMISFNILDALKNITAISQERVANGSTLLPWCCVDGITVSGK
ncbi:MAG: TldD/PmbA family protein [Defluviitaleaceae bacterium]|nr:TldD/PmbA family protein [Defluviitaleaceae bacterium]MCL2263154.1 TldD/PmbA family protein [Defluviitaleaceae bacterium]